jgi:hypothetical protein
MPLGLGVALMLLAVSVEAAERQPVALGSGRVVIVPVNLAVRAVAEVEPGIEPVWRALLQYFASEEKPAIALVRKDAVSLWNEVMADAKQAGEEGDLYATYARFARRVGEQAEFESIIFPTLVTHPARVNGRVAVWDGVRRPVEVPGQFSESIDTYREGKIWLNRHGASGELAAASLHIAVFSPEGEMRHEGRGGLVLLQELAEPRKKTDDVELVVVMRREPFAAPDLLREGIGAAFRDWPSVNASIAH